MHASEGILLYNERNQRYGLYDQNKGCWIIDGFHCGDCLEVLEDGKWIPTRMESYTDWYLAGTEHIGSQLESMKARILHDW